MYKWIFLALAMVVLGVISPATTNADNNYNYGVSSDNNSVISISTYVTSTNPIIREKMNSLGLRTGAVVKFSNPYYAHRCFEEIWGLGNPKEFYWQEHTVLRVWSGGDIEFNGWKDKYFWLEVIKPGPPEPDLRSANFY